MRARARSCVAVAVTLCGGLSVGCAVSTRGDFDGVRFAPDGSALVIADRHDLLLRDGAVVPVLKSSAARTVHIALSGALLDVGADWRRLPSDELLWLGQQLATHDGLLLKGLPLDRLADGERLVSTVVNGVSAGDFDAAVAPALPSEDAVRFQAIGARQTVTLEPVRVESLAAGGSIELSIEVKREREAGQPGEVATGEVTLTLSTTFLPERLAEANLSVAEPILRCMASTGPARGAACKDEKPLPYVDATGSVSAE